MIRVGIVGSGFWARMIHIPAFQHIAGYEIIGVAAGRPERAKTTAKEFGIRKHYADYDQLIRDRDIDLVDVCAPNA
jgi:predicted dehydrogenase